MKNYPTVNIISSVLLIIGGICWALVGIFRFDLIGAIFPEVLARIIFTLFGLAALWRLYLWIKHSPARK